MLPGLNNVPSESPTLKETRSVWRRAADRLLGRLADPTSASNGASMVGASQNFDYAAGSLGARFNDYICPSDHPFLAVGDGTDEHVKLQLALDAAVAADKPLMFNRLYTGYLDIPDNATLVALSWNCGIRLPNSANRAVLSSADTTNGNDNVQILGMLIDGNRANQSNLASHGINADGPCTNWRVLGNKVKDTLGNGMQSRGGGVPGNSTTATDIIVEGNLWQDVGNVDTGANGRDGLYFNRTQLFRIINNTIERAGRQGVALEGSGAKAIATRRYIVAHNTIRDSTSGGIDDEANEGGDSLIVSNLIENGGGVGIRASGLTGNFLVADNHITNPGSRGLDIEVRQTSYAANCNVIGNIVNTTGTEGIKVNAAGTTTVALNNVRTAGTIGMYIRSVSGDKGLRVEGNTVNGSGQEGLVMDRPCDGMQLLGNTIIDAGSVAFPSPAYSIRGSTGTMASPVIANNVAIESRGTPYTTYAFTFSNMDSPIIHGNSVFGTTATGDVNFPTTVPANVIFGPNKWDWARITGAPSSYKAAYNGAAALGSIAWDADAAPTLTISSNVITPTTRRAFVGAGLIKTITAPIATGGGTITLIPTAAFTTDTTANVAIASTAVVGRAMTMTYDSGTTKWYPSY